jgi:biopolymer transport protein ExbD
MVQLNSLTPGQTQPRVKRMIKRNLKIDMTPMVDLGFLLIAFFVFTTSFNQPTSMNLYMPKDGIPTLSPQSQTITFIIAAGGLIYYYPGTEEEAVKNNRVSIVSYDEKTGIGKTIRTKQLQLEQAGIDKKELIVLIKPTKESTYKNAVDVLDEMTINGVTRYAIVKTGVWDKQYLESHR